MVLTRSLLEYAANSVVAGFSIVQALPSGRAHQRAGQRRALTRGDPLAKLAAPLAAVAHLQRLAKIGSGVEQNRASINRNG